MSVGIAVLGGVLDNQLLIYIVVDGELVVVGKVLCRIFADGGGIQAGETDGVGSVGVGKGLPIQILAGWQFVVFIHHSLVGGIGDILDHSFVLVSADIANTADGRYLVAVLFGERIPVVLFGPVVETVVRLGTPFLGTDDVGVIYRTSRAGDNPGAPFQPFGGVGGVHRVIQAGRWGKGFISHPHSYQLVDGSDVPADLFRVYDPVEVVVPVTGEAGIGHEGKVLIGMVPVILQFRGIVGDVVIQKLAPIQLGTRIQAPDDRGVDAPVFSILNFSGNGAGKAYFVLRRPPGPGNLCAVLSHSRAVLHFVQVLRSPDGLKVRRIDVVESLDGLLDNGVVGVDNVALAVFAVLGFGKDVQLPGRLVYKLAPQLWIGSRDVGKLLHRCGLVFPGVVFVVILVYIGRYVDNTVPVIAAPRIVLFFPGLVYDVFYQLLHIHQGRAGSSVLRRPGRVIGHPIGSLAGRVCFSVIGIDTADQVVYGKLYPQIVLAFSFSAGAERGLDIPGDAFVQIIFRILENEVVVLVVGVAVDDAFRHQKKGPFLSRLVFRIGIHFYVDAAGILYGNIVGIPVIAFYRIVVHSVAGKVPEVHREFCLGGDSLGHLVLSYDVVNTLLGKAQNHIKPHIGSFGGSIDPVSVLYISAFSFDFLFLLLFPVMVL